MPAVQTPQDLTSIRTPEDFARFGSALLGQIITVMNGGLEFQSNIKSRIIGATFTAANTDTVFNHNLGYVPTGFIPIYKTAAGDIYTGSLLWTQTTITLKCTTVVGTKLIVF